MNRKKINILWLMSDQHNANCLGVAGHPDLKTPHLDSIAKRGTRFLKAYCNNPICAPSRSSFLSGQYVKTHGISGNYVRHLTHPAPNLARLFKQNGYQTALIGKAHLPYQWVKEGFEHIRFTDMTDAEYDNPRSCHYFDDLVNAGLGDLYDHGTLFPRDHGYGKASFISELPEEYSLEAWTGRKAVEFLGQRDLEKPFFLKVSFQRPHDPYAPPASRATDYPPETIHIPDSATDYFEQQFSGKPAAQQEYIQSEKGGYPYRSESPKELQEAMSRHFALINMIDDAIGKILETLEAQGELDNTVIAYNADHGDFAGEHGLVLKNLGIYESIHRIPFLLAGPGIPAGSDCDRIINSIDFYPTIAELAGLNCESEVDGTSIVNRKDSVDTYSICEWEDFRTRQRVYAVRDNRFRFVHYDAAPDDGELYDCEADPDELNNLFKDPALQPEKERLKERIEAYQLNAKYTWELKDDLVQTRIDQDTPTYRIRKLGVRWSELKSQKSVSA